MEGATETEKERKKTKILNSSPGEVSKESRAHEISEFTSSMVCFSLK